MARLIRNLGAILIVLAVASCGEPRQAMVATADKRASEAALAVLAEGGSAVDAAIAAQLVLGLVEPQSSGIGGGAFLLHWTAASGRMDAYDGRETAPASARADLFLMPDGQPMAFMDAVVGGRSVGVPGIVRMMWMAHQAHGRLPWSRLFAPAVTLARDGFAVSPRLAEALAEARPLLEDPAARAYIARPDSSVPDGFLPVGPGTQLTNPAYAETLERIAEQGPDGFYQGPVAEAIVAAVRSHANAGGMTLQDLEGYKAVRREPVCRPYRSYEVCGMPPPSSGGLTTLMILGMLEHYRLGTLQPMGVTALHLLSEASALAFADRDRFMADADFVPVPMEGLLDRRYLAERAALINPGRSLGKAQAGAPPGAVAQAEGLDRGRAGTSHLTIVDAEGNVVSMTSSIEGPFGAHIMAAGFFLNNELTDFSFAPSRDDGTPVANAVAPGKRPRSSMSPTIVLDEHGRFFAALGSPGGSRIIGYVVETLIALLDWKYSMQGAIDLPRVLDRNGPVELEGRTDIVRLAPALEAMGHEVITRLLASGLQGIARGEDGRLSGGADPRREGVVLELEPASVSQPQ
ncbi:gamma-glutamyltransferase [Rhodoligotrophos defluvii]|uniref:gamma-glutamyltransferase n=1 Tax=Rhodoligotrophos defluvii TaxID=2561934 RepID=UPI00148529D5|nr:gamma-glutamyltransferase [Rhodoligotrophos defluvii]